VQRKIILPLIKHHAADAAFYWQVINGSLLSPIHMKEDLTEFNCLLLAHLDGLTEAGDLACDEAFEKLQIFPMEGEAFVCWYLALKRMELPWIETLLKFCFAEDNVWPGVIGALATQADETFQHFAQSWLETTDATLHWVVLEACAIRSEFPPWLNIQHWLLHNDEAIRAAACKLLGTARHRGALPLLMRLREDSAPSVREQAALAYFLLSPQSDDVALPLGQAMHRYLRIAEEESGLDAVIAQRDAELLVCFLGHVLPCGDPRMERIISALPPRLSLLLIAQHGDPAYLETALQKLDNQPLARLAYWTLCFITGLEPNTLMWHEKDMPPEWLDNEGEEKENINDVGLHWPQADAVRAWFAQNRGNYPAGKLLLAGQEPDAAHCRALLEEGSQAQRFAASLRLLRLDPKAPYLDTRRQP